ncbi:MAG: hypothetical protein M5R41_19330 [Bacteroidia bacterium]|nr:hypothetical protein [Bacteroidia bacterium]
MAQFTVIINGKEMQATGSMLSEVSTTGKTYSVVLIDSLLLSGKDYKSFLKPRDAQLRADELKGKQDKLDAAWQDSLAKYKAENPDADAAAIEAYKAYWLTLPATRQFTSNLTSGLTATIVDADGIPHSAYFMREASAEAPRFRTYVPKERVVLEDCPF